MKIVVSHKHKLFSLQFTSFNFVTSKRRIDAYVWLDQKIVKFVHIAEIQLNESLRQNVN